MFHRFFVGQTRSWAYRSRS